MALRMLVCPTCDGTGAGSASMKGPTSAAGQCADCLATGEVTVEKRARLLAKAEGALFPDDGLRVAAAEPVTDDRTHGQKMRDRQQARIALGRHPLGDTIRLHPDAPRDAHKDDERTYPTCGTCEHRQMVGGHSRSHPKCLIGYERRELTDEERSAHRGTIYEHGTHSVYMGPRYSMSETSDCKSWWPGCESWEPKDVGS